MSPRGRGRWTLARPGPFRQRGALAETAIDPGIADRGTHHSLAEHEVVLLLETDTHRGLTDEQAQRRAEVYGPNELPAPRGHGVLRRIFGQFHNPLIYVLLVAGAITTALGQYIDASVIFAVVAANAVVGFVQESRAEAALAGLRTMVRTEARVVRDGRSRSVPSATLVPGDLVEMEAGDKVPADVRLISVSDMWADESALTGASEPVAKTETVVDRAAPVADRANMGHAGTLITRGAGVGVVVATGAETEIGEIHRLVGEVGPLATPLTKKLTDFARLLTVVILALAAVTFAIGLLRHQDPVQTFTAAVALAVGAIPEGLPAAVTIALAIGVSRMARRGAVVRQLPAVETLGSTTVICSDKTGTLTRNEMTVRRVWTPDGQYRLTGSGYDPQGDILEETGEPVVARDRPALWLSLLAGAGCTDAALHQVDDRWQITGDPTEAAMLVAAAKGGIDGARLATERPRTATIAFSSDRQYMATLHRDRHNRHAVLAKGAVERVVDLCNGELGDDGLVRPIDRERVLDAAQSLAADGDRVLATATVDHLDEPDEFTEDAISGTLLLTGLQAMQDPPRDAAVASVASCRSAGISVKMITGDHPATAVAIARQVGLLDDDVTDRDAVLTGADLRALPDDGFAETVDRVPVFARIAPEQKLRLVEALQERGHVVAMTGDGVNDAPALRQSDIGVAMGASGTEVAKDAADIVLTEDNFSNIEAAVEEGRGAFDNLTKFITWTLPTNLGEGLVILVAILVGTALPILPTQILWINMTTAVLLGLMLAFEPKEAGIMSRSPRDPARPLLTRALVSRIVLVSTLIVAGAWWIFAWEQMRGASGEEARTAAVNLFVMAEIFYLFSCRTLAGPVRRVGWLTNRWVIGGVAIQVAAQIALTYLPALNTVFGTVPIGIRAWLRILVVAVLVAVVVGVHKRLLARRPDVSG